MSAEKRELNARKKVRVIRSVFSFIFIVAPPLQSRIGFYAVASLFFFFFLSDYVSPLELWLTSGRNKKAESKRQACSVQIKKTELMYSTED